MIGTSYHPFKRAHKVYTGESRKQYSIILKKAEGEGEEEALRTFYTTA